MVDDLQNQAQPDPEEEYYKAQAAVKQAATPATNQVGPGKGTAAKINAGVNAGVADPMPASSVKAPTSIPSLSGATAAPTSTLPPLQSADTDKDEHPLLNPEADAKAQAKTANDFTRTAGIDNLQQDAKGINNKVLRPLGETGAGALKLLSGIGGFLGGPKGGFMRDIPGTEQNLKQDQDKDLAQQKSLQALEEVQSKIGLQNAQADAEGSVKNAGQVLSEYTGPNGEAVVFDKNSKSLMYEGADGQQHSDGIQRYLAPDKPSIEKLPNGDVLSVITDPRTGQSKPTVIYHGDPKLETKMVVRDVGKTPHTFLVNGQTGEDIKDLGEHFEKQAAGPTFYLPNPDGSGGYVASHNPGPGALTAAGVNTANSPTQAQKTRSGIVADTLKGLPGILEGIDNNAGEIGPVQGRINRTLMANGLSKNTSLSNEVSQIELLKTGVGMAHYGVRGGPADFRKMQDEFYSIAQDPAVLKAHIQGGMTYLNNYLEDNDKSKLKEDDTYNKLPPGWLSDSPAVSGATSTKGGSTDPHPENAKQGEHRIQINGKWGSVPNAK